MLEKLYIKYLQLFSSTNIKNKFILKRIIKYIKNKNVLEVGCGYGSFTYLMSLYSSSVDAIDIDKKIISSAKFSENVNYYNISIEEYETKKKYDTIVCLQVIEHIKNDIFAIEKMKKLLKDNGYIIISTPSSDELKKYKFPIVKILKKIISNKNNKFIGELLKESPHGHVRLGYNFNDFKKISEILDLEIVDIFYEKSSLILYEIYFILPSFLRVLLTPLFSILELFTPSRINEKNGLSIYVIFRKTKNIRKKHNNEQKINI